VRRIADEEEALELADDAATMLKPFLAEGNDEMRAMYGALQLHGEPGLPIPASASVTPTERC
jgi:hypothetical protein